MQFKSQYQPGESEWREQQPSMHTPIPPPYTRPEMYQQVPQQPPLQPAPPPALPGQKHLSRANFYIIFSVVCLVILLGAWLFLRSYFGLDTSSSAPASGTWTTTHIFSGNGIKETEVFMVSSDWQLQWTCDPSSFPANQYNVIIYVYNADGTMAGLVVNTLCSATNTNGNTELHQGGSIYLAVNSEAAWTLTIQELE